MEDAAIIGLYWARDERAITASDEKYGKLCRALSQNILDSREDAEECVNDTWQRAWDTMPPQRPGSLRAYLAKITRNLSIERWLDTLSPADRTAFLRRYWYGQRVDRVAAQAGCSPNSMAKRLGRLRDGLRRALEQEGINL